MRTGSWNAGQQRVHATNVARVDDMYTCVLTPEMAPVFLPDALWTRLVMVQWPTAPPGIAENSHVMPLNS